MTALHVESHLRQQSLKQARNLLANEFPAPSGAEPREGVLGDAVERMSVPRRLARGMRLFARGDLASNYYLVESGALLVGSRGFVGPVRRLEPGELFIYECNHAHVANCEATVDSIVHCIDRGRLERLAVRTPELKGALHLVHSTELPVIHRFLGY